MNILLCLNTWATVLEWTLTTLQPFNYLWGDCLDHSWTHALISKTQIHLNNGQRWHKDTRETSYGNMPSIPIRVEQITDNNKQTNQVDSFGRGIKEINLQGKPPHLHLPPRDPDAIDISAVVRKAMTEAEKDKCKKEGWCFKCGKQGHLMRNCPDQKPCAWTATTKESNMTTIATVKSPSPAEIAGFLTQFSTTDKEEFVKSMRELRKDMGFQEAQVQQLSFRLVVLILCMLHAINISRLVSWSIQRENELNERLS